MYGQIDAEVLQCSDISDRSRLAWESIPDHLHYDRSCWETDTTPAKCLMLLSVYLDYLNSKFHIERLICRFSEAAKADLLGISNEMLTTVMVLIKQHNLTRELQRDYAWIVSLQRNLLKNQYRHSQS